MLGCLACALSAGCARPEAGPAPEGPRVAFDLRPDAGLFDAPFPSAHRLGDDGRVRVDDWPNPDGVPYVSLLLDLAREATGFGTTSGVMFRLDDPATALAPVDLAGSVASDAQARIVAIDGPDAGRQMPFDLWTSADGGPFGAPGLVTLLPLQGVPLAPDTTYAAFLLRDLGATEPLGVPDDLWRLTHGERPDGWAPEVVDAYLDAVVRLTGLVDDLDPYALAGLAVFRTWDPTDGLRATASAARAAPPPPLDAPLALIETYDTFCVYETTVQMPEYQAGDWPYTTGGGWIVGGDGVAEQQGTATSRLWLTVPRSPAPPAGYPVTVMVRTGGGGDRPLIDRGVRGEPGGEPLEPGTGPALELAAIGAVGVQVDGPHGGPYRDPTGADEQFLMFNVSNPLATRDNVRESALELALLPGLLSGLAADGAAAGLDGSGCAGADPGIPLDLGHLALLGHSMGSTIAPLTLAVAPEFGASVLSGSGGSYLYNLVYKRSPLDVRPIAEALLGFTAIDRVLREDEPVLQLVQWVSEPADPPPYAAATPDPHVLMVQGIVDTYILPPMANANTLAFGLDPAGALIDVGVPELAGMRSIAEVVPFGDGALVPLPATAPAGEPLRVLVQVAEDGIEDGHEVLFQTDVAKAQYRGFLDTFAGGTPVVPAP